jgi:DNA repair exonuclease SbcCD ATPase subunit
MSSFEDNPDETLRRQFEQLQAQQQRRLKLLQRRTEHKLTQRESDDSAHNASHTSPRPSFGVTDDLDLKLPEHSQHNSQVNHSDNDIIEQLREKIRELKDETGRLYKLLSERDLEVRQLRRKLDEDRAVQSAGAAGDGPAATKIVELSKRVRELTAELESERTKSKQFARKCQELERQSLNSSNDNQPSSSAEAVPSSTDDLKNLQDKLKQTESKVTEHRNQIQSLKAELKVLQKVLSQEVGDGVQLQTLLNSSSGWRGRAQQITTLQKKVNDLKKQVEQLKQGSVDMNCGSDPDDMMTHRVSHCASDKQKEKIRQIERQKKEAQEKMATDIKNLEQENELLKQKLEAGKARITILTTETKTHKQQIQTLLDKGRHDDELIEALFKQQSQLKKAIDESGNRTRENQQVKHSATSQQQQSDSHVIEHLKAIVADKEAKVKKT